MEIRRLPRDLHIEIVIRVEGPWNAAGDMFGAKQNDRQTDRPKFTPLFILQGWTPLIY